MFLVTRIIYRYMTGVSLRLQAKALYLWYWKGLRSLNAYKKRSREGKQFPPFLFLALTDACNLRCKGCWISRQEQVRQLSLEQIDKIIESGKTQKSFYYTLLGGEPMLYPSLNEILRNHSDCYFQIITNGLFFDASTVRELKALGNVTPLVSLDGLNEFNDQRRGEGVYDRVLTGLAELKRQKMLFGIATVVTAQNFDNVLSDQYVKQIIDFGAQYLWFYVFRPSGAAPSHNLALTKEQLIEVRRRLLALRKRQPIIIIDTYWDADGQAVCPAAKGLGYHIGPAGSIEPCPPLSYACETIDDNQSNLTQTIESSRFLPAFREFVNSRTHGCVILERPGELAQFLREEGVKDYSRREDGLGELACAACHPSHFQPEAQLPEDFWLYRFLKKRLFFGLGAYG